jgi:hypothetical protein
MILNEYLSVLSEVLEAVAGAIKRVKTLPKMFPRTPGATRFEPG